MSRTIVPQRTVDCEPFRCPTCARLTSYNPRHPSGSTCEHCGGMLWEDSEARCPDPECGELLSLIDSGAVGHCGRHCSGDASNWTVCEGGCGRALPVDEAEHAQCRSLLVYCSDCLADHARTCLVCGAA